MRDKIAIIITTFERPILLNRAIDSILNNWNENFIILVGNQSKRPSTILVDIPFKLLNFSLPFNCGLSYARNFLVEQAYKLDCDYCIISADSICFDESMRDLTKAITFLGTNPQIGRMGFLLKGRINWEGWLRLIPNECFELELIDTTMEGIYLCNCIKNFFIARTDTLLDIKWDENLRMAEHEDFQLRYAEKWGTTFTNSYSGNYIGVKEGEFAQYRQENWNEGMKYLLDKYSIKQWIRYTNPELFNRSV